jgi:hypothetical protein
MFLDECFRNVPSRSYCLEAMKTSLTKNRAKKYPLVITLELPEMQSSQKLSSIFKLPPSIYETQAFKKAFLDQNVIIGKRNLPSIGKYLVHRKLKTVSGNSNLNPNPNPNPDPNLDPNPNPNPNPSSSPSSEVSHVVISQRKFQENSHAPGSSSQIARDISSSNLLEPSRSSVENSQKFPNSGSLEARNLEEEQAVDEAS